MNDEMSMAVRKKVLAMLMKAMQDNDMGKMMPKSGVAEVTIMKGPKVEDMDDMKDDREDQDDMDHDDDMADALDAIAKNAPAMGMEDMDKDPEDDMDCDTPKKKMSLREHFASQRRNR